MSLLEDIKAWYEGQSYPPEGPELDSDGDTVTEQISCTIIDDTPRWGSVIQAVYQRGDELVAVEDISPATEMQDWGDYGKPTVYEAKPVEVTVTRYEGA